MIRHVTAFLATVLLILTGNAFGAAPANDNFANATILNQTVPFSVNGTNVSSTAESSEPHHAGAAAAKSVWYSWTPANTISIMLSTSGSALDTTLAVYTGSALNALTVVASNADIVTPSNTASQVSFSATGETTYYIAIDGNNASENTFTLAFSQATTVGVVALVDHATEGGASGIFQITRSGNISSAMIVDFSIGGSAQASVDYQRVDESVILAANQSSTTVTIAPIDNTRYAANATVVLTLNPSPGAMLDPETGILSASAPYAIDPLHSSATITIADNDPVANDKAEAVSFSPAHGFYDTQFSLAMTSATPGAQIRYTTDGTMPTSSSTLYSAPIAVNSTTAFRAAAFMNTFNPSKSTASTYIFVNDVVTQSSNGAAPAGWPSSWGSQPNRFNVLTPNRVDYGMDPAIVNNATYGPELKADLKTLPIISITIKLDDLFNPSADPYVGGIYANSIQEDVLWEKPCSIEYFDPANAVTGFQANCGVRIRGGASSLGDDAKHSFRFYFRDEYGGKKLDYPLFGPDPAAKSFQQFDLAAFSQDSWGSGQGSAHGIFIRDLFCHDTHLEMGGVTPRTSYVQYYINGQFWGLAYLEEHGEATFAANYLGGDADEYDVVKAKYGVVYATAGQMDAWESLWKQCKAGLSGAAAYYKIQGRNSDSTLNPAYENLLDVDALIDFMLVHYYAGNRDGPISGQLGATENIYANNFIGARNRNGGAGFRFFVHDAEWVFIDKYFDSIALNENRLGPFTAGDSIENSNPQWIFQQCLANGDFRQRLVDVLYKRFLNNGVLSATACTNRFKARMNQINGAVVAESARWGNGNSSSAYTKQTWLTECNNLIANYFPTRSTVVLNQFLSQGYYNSVNPPTYSQNGGTISGSTLNLTITNPNGSGTIYYTTNGKDPRSPGGSIQGTGGGTTSVTLPLSSTITIRSRILNVTTWSPITEATFTATQDFSKLKVTEIMYNPPDMGVIASDQLEFLELKNTGSTPLSLSSAQFNVGITYTFPSTFVLNAGQFVVLCSNANSFATKYPGVTPTGVFTGHLSNGGETLTLVSSTGTTLLSFSYSDAAPWPAAADGNGFSLVPQNTASPGDPGVFSTWRPSTNAGGSPGADDPAYDFHGRVIINETLTHSNLPLVDYIELYNPGTSPVDISGWYLTDDRNTPKKFKIPAGTVLNANQYLVYTETNFNPSPGCIKLFSEFTRGESVYVFAADANGNLTGYSHGFDFGASAPDVSFGRYTISTGDDHFVAQVARTPSAANSLPKVGPIVINEIMYHPAAGGDTYVELLNISNSAVQLFDPNVPANTWKLAGAKFTFPQNITVPSAGLVVICAIDPAAFRQKYSVPASTQIFGPYAGTLQLNGETLALERPDTPDVDNNGLPVVPYVLVEAVKYSNTVPWPIEPDGNGQSLQRKDFLTYGNDPINWIASSGIGGTPGTTASPIPVAPSGPAAVAISGSQISVTWTDNSSNEQGFRVERSLDGVTNWQQVADVGANVTSTQDTGALPATHYYYRIYAYTLFGNSDYTSVADTTTPQAPPLAPSNLGITIVAYNHIDLLWTDTSTNESNFIIERSPDGVNDWVTAGTSAANATTFQDFNVAELTTYYYRVFANNESGSSPASNVAMSTTLSSPPPVPALTIALAQFDHIDLTWTDTGNNEIGFKIERSLDGVTNWILVASPNANETSFTNGSLTPQTAYYYRIYAYNQDYNSAYSNIASATTPQSPPSAPTTLSIMASVYNHVDLSWSDTSNNETGFKVERSPDGVDNWTIVGSNNANITTFKDASVLPETTYVYRVYAVNVGNQSDYSNVVSTTTPVGAPRPPTSLSATTHSDTQISLAWTDASDNELGFKIERSLNGVDGWTKVIDGPANVSIAQDNGLMPVTMYYYRVYATNAIGSSTFSNVTSAITFSPLTDDSDGDGVNDGDELAAGTDPNDPASFPTTAMPTVKLACKANFKALGKDTATITGVFPGVPAKFTSNLKPMAVNVAGVAVAFIFDAKNKAKTVLNTAAITLKLTRNKVSKANEFLGGDVKYTIKLKGDFKNNWLDEGFTALPPKTKAPITMNLEIHFAGKVYIKSVPGSLLKNSFTSSKL